MKFKKFIAPICTFAFILSNFINVHAANYKVVLVGNSETEKTSVLAKMADEGRVSTSGATIVTVRNDTLEIWNTSGQEEFRSLIPTYLKSAETVAIFVSPDVPMNSVYYWKNMVDANCSSAKIVLAANKWGSAGDTFYEELEHTATALGINLGNIFCVDAGTGDGIDRLTEGLLPQ
ncbi:MAG: hypothetical protein LBR79_05675 [Oscillospiraceae bacterium]|jgi:GTPase SAR1 family protein|nr:hypothetical protein [Oscillospiraceae bacterium]